jgi:hypothetical protein
MSHDADFSLADHYNRACQVEGAPAVKEFEELHGGLFRAFIYPPGSSVKSYCAVGLGKKAAFRAALQLWKGTAAPRDVLYTITVCEDERVVIQPMSLAPDYRTNLNVSNCGPAEYIAIGVLLNSALKVRVVMFECHAQLPFFTELRRTKAKGRCTISEHLVMGPLVCNPEEKPCTVDALVDMARSVCDRHLNALHSSQEQVRALRRTVQDVRAENEHLTRVCAERYRTLNDHDCESDQEVAAAYDGFGGHSVPLP